MSTPGVRLARLAVARRSITLPEDVINKVKVHLLDSIAAIVSGSALTAGIAGQTYVKTRGGEQQASVVGLSAKVPVIEAALGNGMSAHADESDDSHETSQTHPGCAVVPAILAVSEWLGSTGEETTRAMELAYEVTIRFGEALVPCMSFARSSLSCHAVAPLFGAGFGVGALMGFNEAQYLALLNYLAQEASGLTTWRLDTAHTLKSYVFAGMSASNAVKCALMIRAGWTGAGDVLGDDRNFFDAISPNKKLSLDLEGFNTVFRILETDLKKYSVGFPIAAPLAAMEDLKERHNISSDQISRVQVVYLRDWFMVIGDANKMPDLNLRHCLAALLVEGRLTFDASHDEERMKDEKIIEMGRRIEFVDAPADQERFTAIISVTLKDGTQVEASRGQDIRGRYQNPMTREESNSKARELMGTVLSDRKVDEVISLVNDLDKLSSISKLIDSMSG